VAAAGARAGAQVVRLADLNTTQIRALDRTKTVVFLPGGMLEEHGPYLPAYTDGVRAEGVDVTEEAMRRAHALHLMVFSGLSTLPLEHLAHEPTPELHAVAAERAVIARFALDLLDATG